jgi:hypothetical protein
MLNYLLLWGCCNGDSKVMPLKGAVATFVSAVVNSPYSCTFVSGTFQATASKFWSYSDTLFLTSLTFPEADESREAFNFL